jgi:hypothetical protein
VPRETPLLSLKVFLLFIGIFGLLVTILVHFFRPEVIELETPEPDENIEH